MLTVLIGAAGLLVLFRLSWMPSLDASSSSMTPLAWAWRTGNPGQVAAESADGVGLLSCFDA
jgi:hypothetical protein